MTYPQPQGQPQGQQPHQGYAGYPGYQSSYGASQPDPFQRPGSLLGGPEAQPPRNKGPVTAVLTAVAVLAVGAITAWVSSTDDEQNAESPPAPATSTAATSTAAPSTSATSTPAPPSSRAGTAPDEGPPAAPSDAQREVLDGFAEAVNSGNKQTARAVLCELSQKVSGPAVDRLVDGDADIELDYSSYERSTTGGGIVQFTDRSSTDVSPSTMTVSREADDSWCVSSLIVL